jgi:hypothetical protein
MFRSYLKKVFWPKLFVGASFQVSEILMYSCGLKLDPASILVRPREAGKPLGKETLDFERKRGMDSDLKAKNWTGLTGSLG